MKKIVFLTGAGMSAESGIDTFRDAGGLWENHNILDVASPEGWHKNPKLVLDFYNARKAHLQKVKPNSVHKIITQLEKIYNVQIITQNVDNLHEKAGSKNILHLHGELTKVRSTVDPSYIKEQRDSIKMGDTCPKGGQLRPHIVWFGEPVPFLETAINITQTADIFVIVGTSMEVYPAASLIDFVPPKIPMFYIDPSPNKSINNNRIKFINKNATIGLKELLIFL